MRTCFVALVSTLAIGCWQPTGAEAQGLLDLFGGGGAHQDWHNQGHLDQHNGHLDWHDTSHWDTHNNTYTYPTYTYPQYQAYQQPSYSWQPQQYSTSYGSTNMASSNPLPLPSVNSPVQTRVINPPESRVSLSFSMNGQMHSLQAGYQQEFRGNQSRIIEFDRGGSYGRARYGLETGVYTFEATTNGWELYHSPFQTFQTNSGPTPIGGAPGVPSASPPPAGN